jgi:hypothetical protein
MTTLAINKLWSFIQSLSMTESNERWLAARLLESADAKASKSARKTEASKSWANYQLSAEIENLTLRDRECVSDTYDATLYAAMEEKYR